MNNMVRRLLGAVSIAALGYAATWLDPFARLVIALVLGIPSFVLMAISRRQLGQAFAVMPKATTLVTRGLYSKIQHPMYLFLDLVLLSLIVLFGQPLYLAGWALLAAVQLLQADREERLLAKSFGDKYAAYVDQTWI